MNPRSGDGTVARFGLREVAERLGAEVLLTGPGQDAASLARRALEDGAEVLGVAGGDGTVSTVAAVAAEADVPLVVVPAGTRNHFARDLGLDIGRPAAALAALDDGEQIRVDLGSVNGRTFLNNVSFGVYAEALLAPGYREGKARAFASTAGPYLQGRQWVEVDVETPMGTVERPQLVLVSNNPYHLTTHRQVGRLALNGGILGVVVLKRPPGSPPEPLTRLVDGMRQRGATPLDEGLFIWSAPEVTLNGAAATVTAGVDGETLTLSLPVTCEIRPEALRVLLPLARPGRRPAGPGGVSR
jgi:diacylglycerol kinase family enzyme